MKRVWLLLLLPIVLGLILKIICIFLKYCGFDRGLRLQVSERTMHEAEGGRRKI